MISSTRQKLAMMMSNEQFTHYLQSSGTQYIDTGILFDPTLSFEVEAKAEIFSYNRQVVCGDYKSGSVSAFSLEFFNNASNPKKARAFIQVGASHSKFSERSVTLNEPHIVGYKWTPNDNKMALFYDGVKGTANVNVSSPLPHNTDTARVFLDNRSNTSAIAYPLRLYYLKIRKNNVLVRYFIPKLDNDNVPCLFDKISGTNFYNKGTGDFVYG